MQRLLGREAIVPAITFVLGALVSKLLDRWVETRDPVLLTLQGLIVCIVVLVAVTLKSAGHSAQDRQITTATLERLSETLGLSVRYVVDGDTGESYKQAAELIRKARESLTFVDLWHPWAYGSQGDGERQRAREDFYQAILEKADAHALDPTPFHRRIVQTPHEYEISNMAADADPLFWSYLRRVCELQSRHSGSCVVRFVNSPVIKTHFVIIDRRYIVIPLLTTIDQKTDRQKRHGALFFDDRVGSLFEALRGVYRALDAQSRSLTLAELTPKTVTDSTST